MISIIHYAEGCNLISTLENMVIKMLSRGEGYSIQIPGDISQKSGQILTKEAFFGYKMCHNFKSIKSMKEYIPYVCRPSTSEDLH